MEEQCSICNDTFHESLLVPLLVCRQQHFVCAGCHFSILQHQIIPKCPECRQRLASKYPVEFQLYRHCDRQIQNYKGTFFKDLLAVKRQIEILVNQLVKDFDNREQGQNLFDFIRQSAISLMKSGDFQSASILLSTLIDKYSSIAEKQRLLGLGSFIEQEGYRGSERYEWYEQRYGEDISLYDLLGISLLKSDFQEKQKIQYYEKMHSKDKASVGILYGLAVSQLNADEDQEALTYFEEIIKIDDSFSKPFLMKAYIHYKQNAENNLIIQNAQQCLQRDEGNLLAQIFLRIAKSSSQEEICQRMEQMFIQETSYASPLFIIAKELPDRTKAIPAFQRCIAACQSFIDAHIELAVEKINLKQVQSARHILTRLLTKNRLNNLQKWSCYYYLGSINYYYSLFDVAIVCFDEAQKYDKGDLSYLQYETLRIDIYYNQQKYEQVIAKGNQIIASIKSQLLAQKGQQSKDKSRHMLLKGICLVVGAYIAKKKFCFAIDLLKEKQLIEAQIKETSEGYEYNDEYCRYFVNKIKSFNDFQSDAWHLCCVSHNYQINKACVRIVQSLFRRKKVKVMIQMINDFLERDDITEQTRIKLQQFKSRVNESVNNPQASDQGQESSSSSQETNQQQL